MLSDICLIGDEGRGTRMRIRRINVNDRKGIWDEG
jgi:hypothetical protein